MKQYKFEIIIDEGNDEFWEELQESGTTGCNEVMEMIRESFRDTGLEMNATVILREYRNE